MADEYFIERRDDGDYTVKQPNAERASAVTSTQAEAIEKARQFNPDATIHVERVRHHGPDSKPEPDKWRNP